MNTYSRENLGRFIRVRERKDGTHDVFMSVPSHLRPSAWPATIRLPEMATRPGSLTNPKFRDRVIADAIRLNASLDAQRDRAATLARSAGRTVVELAEIYYASTRYLNLSKGRKYRNKRDVEKVVQWAQARGNPPFSSFLKPQIEEFLSAYNHQQPTKLEMRSIWNVLCKEAVGAGWRADNPCDGLSWRAPDPKKLRIWNKEDVERFNAMAISMGQPALGALIAIQFFSGQRLGDLLTCKYVKNYTGARLRFRQSKTRKLIDLAVPADLRRMLEAVKVPGSDYLLTDADTGGPFNVARLQARFREVRHAIQKPNEHLFQLRALRHSAVCRYIRGHLTLPQIAAITGHSPISVHRIIVRYAIDPRRTADEALKQLNREDGGVDDDFIDDDLDTQDWVGDDERIELYQSPALDPSRALPYIAAKKGLHRLSPLRETLGATAVARMFDEVESDMD